MYIAVRRRPTEEWHTVDRAGTAHTVTAADVAVLVIAHRDPDAVARLTASLDCPWIDTFVHIDRKVAIEPFRRACAHTPAEFLPDRARIRVNWGGFSLVQAILNTMQHAHGRRRYRRYILLSGADLLVKPLPALREALTTDDEYLRIDRVLTADSPRLNRLHHYDAPGPIRKLLADRIPRRLPPSTRMYHGSTWWALTGEAVDHILHTLRSDRTATRFLRGSSCPDEIVFHTIIAESPLAHRISDDRTRGDGSGHPDVHGLHHIVWSDSAYSPRDLTATDIAALRSTPACFARKIGADSGAVVREFARL